MCLGGASVTEQSEAVPAVPSRLCLHVCVGRWQRCTEKDADRGVSAEAASAKFAADSRLQHVVTWRPCCGGTSSVFLGPLIHRLADVVLVSHVEGLLRVTAFMLPPI